MLVIPWWCRRLCDGGSRKTNLEGSAETEDTIVGLLGRETLDGSLDDVVLLGDQVIVSGMRSVLSLSTTRRF